MAGIASLLHAAPNYVRLLRSQYWNKDVLEVYRLRRLDQTLRAAAEIAFYRERIGPMDGRAELQSIPTLKRSEIPLLNQSVRERFPRETRFFHDSSSGSTGMPVEFLFDAAYQNGRYSARIRYLRANGWNPARVNVWIVGLTSERDDSLDANISRTRRLLGVRFIPIFDPFERQVDALSALDPVFLYTFPSNLEGLLQVFEQKRTTLRSLRRIFTGSEVLEDSIRDRAKRVLGVDISDNYGSTEGFIAWQCRAGTYHVNAEHVLVEIVDERNQPVAEGQMGKVLLTTLENRLMPLVRYEIGDYAIASGGACGCGRTLPVMGKVIGRGINLFRLPGGRLVSPWPLVGPLKALPQVRQFQIEQETFEHCIVRYAAERALSAEAQEKIQTSFRKILKLSVSVSFEQVDHIPRTAGGKFMTLYSRLASMT
jgi:phenylacetate-CoA ligase